MKTEKKNTLMIWAIVILAVMNFSTLLTIMYHKYQAAKTENISISDKKKSGGGFRKV